MCSVDPTTMKKSPELRPRRRASQTYFFKYQLARNPLKAEEEDLKLALWASLQQCNRSGNGYSNGKDSSVKVVKESASSEKIVTSNSNSGSANHSSKKSKHLNGTTEYCNNNHASNNKTAKSNLLADDEKYRPETEDFLAFICFKTTAPEFQKTNYESPDTNCSHNHNGSNNNNNNIVNNNHETSNHDGNSHNRRPTRQSPRLATSQQKKSAHDNYEEDMKRASIALEDMAQEVGITSNANEATRNDIKKKSAQNRISKLPSSPYKNNRHLVKGLMTREFAGAFADEETIFQSISNHKI